MATFIETEDISNITVGTYLPNNISDDAQLKEAID